MRRLLAPDCTPLANLAPLRATVALATMLGACSGPTVDAYINGAGWVDEADTSEHGSLVIDNDVLTYSAYGLINSGVLTDTGLGRGEEVAQDLVGVDLGTSYCEPDCGGVKATISVVRSGNLDTITYPLGSPPPVLTQADKFVGDIMHSLETCLETTEITPEEDCKRMTAD